MLDYNELEIRLRNHLIQFEQKFNKVQLASDSMLHFHLIRLFYSIQLKGSWTVLDGAVYLGQRDTFEILLKDWVHGG